MAVVNVGTQLVAKTVEECGKHGVPYVLIFTAGFSEVGEAGAALEREVGEVARRYGIRVFGPNTNTNAFEVLPEPPQPAGWAHRARDPERAPGPTARAGDRVRRGLLAGGCRPATSSTSRRPTSSSTSPTTTTPP